MQTRVILGLISTMFVAVAARADDPTAAMPPDIAAIIAKMKGGQMPSPDDLAKLKAWKTGVAGRVNAPAPSNPNDPNASAQPTGIPCRIQITEHYTVKGPNGSIDDADLSGWADALLSPAINGDGDYYMNMLDPKAPASSFRFMPIVAGTGRPANGGGSGSFHHVDKSGTQTSMGQLSHAMFAGMLVTTGSDDLFASGTGFGASIDGTSTATDSSGSHPSPLHESDLRSITGSITAPFADEQRHPAQGGKRTPKPKMKLSYQALAKAVSGSTTATVTGNETFDWTDGVFRTSGTARIEITLRPSPLELIVEPKDEAAFKKWVPWPMIKGSEKIFNKPELLEIHVALHDPTRGAARSPGPTKPNADVGGKIKITIAEVSKHKGICMNYPAQGASDDKPDLFFPKPEDLDKADAAKQRAVTWISESEVETPGPAVEATVIVASRDGAPKASIRASIEALGIQSKDPRTGKPGMEVPLDNNHNDIADGWEDLDHILGKNYAAEWDEEDKPSGMATTGDASTLYEQYRGFVVDDGKGGEIYLRPPPDQKSLFVYLDPVDRELHRQGVQEYAAATGIKIYFITSEARLATAPGDPQPRWVTFNDQTHSVGKRYAVRVVDSGRADDPGITPPLTNAADTARLTPSIVKEVNVSRVGNEGLYDNMRALLDPKFTQVVAAAKSAGIDLVKLYAQTGDAGRKNTVVDRMIVFTTLHEMGHATGARHHGVEAYLKTSFPDTPEGQAANKAAGDKAWASGVKTCPMRYWNYDANKSEILLVMAGTWDLTTAKSHDRWHFCETGDSDWKGMSLKP